MAARKFLIQCMLSATLLLQLSGCMIAPVLQQAGPISQPSQLPDPNQVKELLVQIVDEEERVPGIVVGMIAADPQERWVIGYGSLSATDERVPDGDTVYEIGSISKLFTGILLAQAALKGEVNLDDPISNYLPEGATASVYEGRSITLLDLATHTAGLPRDVYDLDSFGQLIAFLSSYHLTREPGSSYAYSNLGMGLLANILIQSAGQDDYDGLLMERICRPMGMDSTRVQLTEEMSSRLAPPHTSSLDPIHLWHYPLMAGAGGIRSTANDLLTFLAFNLELTKSELQPALQLANTPQRPSKGEDAVGLGWQVASNTGFHWHSGATQGSNSFLAWDPERRFGIVVLANAAVDVNYVARLVVERMPFRQVQDTQQDLDGYAGEYQLLDGQTVTIRVEDSRIFIQLPYEPEYELIASSKDHLYMPIAEFELTFSRNEGGEVDGVVAVVEGVTYEAIKLHSQELPSHTTFVY